jgi:hypothetical protein
MDTPYPLITFNHDPITPDLKLLPTCKFIMHTHTTLPYTTILWIPNSRAVTALSGPRIRHLYQLFRPDLTHHTIEAGVYRLIIRLGTRSERLSFTHAITTCNR